ncbi:MAG: protein translocase SEC61 complex subunit gamma [Candidatus Woesearchaeota archaeon]
MMSAKNGLGRFYNECKRVLRVTRKPKWDEYKTLMKITALGIVAIGLIGFVLAMIKAATGIF